MSLTLRPSIPRIVLTLVATAALPGAAAGQDRPLPDPSAFLAEARKHLQTDGTLQSQYTYIEKRTEPGRDKSATPRVRVFEVYPTLGEEPYRRLIADDGVPVDPKELARKDAKHRKEILEEARKLEREGAAGRAHRLRKEADERRKHEEAIDELFRLYDLRMIGRDSVEGHPTIAFAFTPRPGFKARTDDGKIMKKFGGRAWFSEEDHELARLEVEAIENINVGLGLVARLYKGTRAMFSRRKVNNEVWLPVEARVLGTGRLMIFKKLNIEMISEFSDYKKFTVDTSATLDLSKPPQ